MSFISSTEGWIAESLYGPGQGGPIGGRILHTSPTIQYTKDGGATWQTTFTGVTDGDATGGAYPDKNHLWIVGEGTNDEGPPMLVFSKNGGESFKNENLGVPGVSMHDVVAIGDKAWAAGGGGVIDANKKDPC